MSGFQVPFSSSPAPSTPDRRSGNTTGWFGNNPSTTPAGPPPSSAGSFTPAGPPPSSFFGSSNPPLPTKNGSIKRLSNTQKPTFKSKRSIFSSPKSSPPQKLSNRPTGKSARSGLSNDFTSNSSPPRAEYTSQDEYESRDEEDMPTEEDEEDMQARDVRPDRSRDDFEMIEDNPEAPDRMDEEGIYSAYDHDMRNSMFAPSRSHLDYGRSYLGRSSASNDVMRQSQTFNHSGNMMSSQSRPSGHKASRERSEFKKLAKHLCSQLGAAQLVESDGLILDCEEVLARLYEDGIQTEDDGAGLQQALALVPHAMVKVWQQYQNKSTPEPEMSSINIGPGSEATGLANADFLASLLLRLYSPSIQEAGGHRSTLVALGRSPHQQTTMADVPVVLLDWMDEYHDPTPGQIVKLQAAKPAPAAHSQFWPIVLNSLLRGRVAAVVSTLRKAGWDVASTAVEDGQRGLDTKGYEGVALRNIKTVVADVVQVLEACPATEGDWNINNNAWTIFRLHASQAKEKLKAFAEGRDDETLGASFASLSRSMTAGARKAQSQVPWSIYQRLLTIYDLLLGDVNAVVESAQDWLEATIGLVLWRDPAESDRRSVMRSSPAGNSVEERDMYLNRLTESFDLATAEPSDFQVNAMSPIEVGLACLFESEIEGVIQSLRSWCAPVAAAVVEIAALGDWLPHAESQNLIAMQELDQDDMDVLGLTSSESPSNLKDDILVSYATMLSRRGTMSCLSKYTSKKYSREGWEVAIAILGRLTSTERSEEEIGNLLQDFEFSSDSVVDKLWDVLVRLGMPKHAENITQTYADSLAEHSHKYGEALWYYALSHKAEKVRDVLNLLISLSLIHSMAYPPIVEMDSYLNRLVLSTKSSFTELSARDSDAMDLLQKAFSGYATLRHFYDLRDIGLPTSQATRPMRMKPRRSEAAKALLLVIASADDNIRGGLYDESREAVVSVDFLLALLGEAMVFVNQKEAEMGEEQIYVLLKAIEDVQSVTPRIYNACNEFFETVVASTQGLKGSNPMDLLKKSTSSLSGTGSFSMVGSSMLASQLQQSIGSSGVLVKGNVQRGWDWRRGLSAGTTSQDVLQIIRLGLAKDLGRAWTLNI